VASWPHGGDRRLLAEDECKALADTMRQALDELKAGPGLTGLERKQ